jgi:hypothetical protein
MIHLSIALPLGIDSVFFSFIERLAVQNGHACLDPPALGLEADTPNDWISSLSRSRQHHFVIGYRYPPVYWKQLVAQSATVALLSDADGILRQVERIQRKEQVAGGVADLGTSLLGIRHALDALIEMAEWMLHEGAGTTTIFPPAVAFLAQPMAAFRRIEDFYSQAGVPMVTSCWEGFAAEAYPLLDQVQPVASDLRHAMQRQLTLEESTPSRLEALGALFHQDR